MKLNNKRGVALAITLLIILGLATLSAVFILRAVNEKNIAEHELQMAKAFYIAEGGANSGLDKLDEIINTDLFNTISNTNPNVVINTAQTYVASGDGIDFLIFAAKKSGAPHFVKNGSQAEHVVNSTSLGDGTFNYMIIVTEKADPTAAGTDRWEFPYYYRVQTSGTSGVTGRNIIISGDFTIEVERDNFAKYALFTNQQTLPNGTTNVWFTDKTNFAGPIHTNQRFNIALNPSGTFEGLAEQVEQMARFYNGGSTVLLDADFNGTSDVPTWNAGFNRGAAAKTLSSPVQQTEMINQARAGDTTSGNGIFLAHTGSDLTGGVYVNGNSDVALSVNGSGHAVYTITQGSSTKTITVNESADQTTVDDGVTPVTYNGVPNGVDGLGTLIYVDGQINNVSGTVQKDTELTVASTDDIIVSNHIRYENYTPAVGTPGIPGYVPPSASGEKNLLGLVTWNGDVRIGTTAPNDVEVHGTLLAKSGIFQVDDYDDQGTGPRGTATLLGGVITDYYGAFGLFNGSTGQQLSGFGRNFVYDSRMQVGNAPPYFPSLEAFVAFTNDLTDKIIFQEG